MSMHDSGDRVRRIGQQQVANLVGHRVSQQARHLEVTPARHLQYPVVVDEGRAAAVAGIAYAVPITRGRGGFDLMIR